MIKHRMEDIGEPIEGITNCMVARRDNHIYFYGEINDESQLNFMISFTDAINEFNDDTYIEEDDKEVYLHINCVGGDFSDSMAMYDFLKSQNIKTIGIVEGKCYSGAVALLLGCQERHMTKNSIILIHEIRTTLEEPTKYTDLKDEFENCEKLLAQYKTMLMDNTNMKYDDFTILKHDNYLVSDECLKLGIVDKII